MLSVMTGRTFDGRRAAEMDWEQAEDYFYAKLEQSQFQDREGGREQGLAQFLDDKTIRPGLDTYVG
jgi:feruloyl-CoA hydratase/lyase